MDVLKTAKEELKKGLIALPSTNVSQLNLNFEEYVTLLNKIVVTDRN